MDIDLPFVIVCLLAMFFIFMKAGLDRKVMSGISSLSFTVRSDLGHHAFRPNGGVGDEICIL